MGIELRWLIRTVQKRGHGHPNVTERVLQYREETARGGWTEWRSVAEEEEPSDDK